MGDDNDYNASYTIININISTFISIHHLNQSKADTSCAILYFIIISIVLLCVLICKDQM